MAATGTVYEGVGGGGTLFSGKSFWVAQRVPSRNRWLDDIRANGGTVVQLEKMADILIADHARKDVPAASHSWTYIEQSVKNGRLENLENHVIGRAAGTSRPVGSSEPAKGRRTPFTPEDDRILTAWVTDAERKSVPIKGNALYQDLERANPRHTFQSWRDRWIKTLQYAKRPQTSSEEPTGVREEGIEHEEVDPSNQPQQAFTPPDPTEAVKQSPDAKESSKFSTSSGKADKQSLISNVSAPIVHTHLRTSSKGKTFTAEEAMSLLMIYDDIENIEDRRWDEAWKAWADNYPEHSAEEWEEFWLTDVRPAEERRRTATSKSSLRGTDQVPAEITDIGDDKFENYDVLDSQSFTISREEFANARGEPVEMEPAICGRKVPLFRLWQVVHDELGGFDSVESTGRWPLVGAKLNFNTFRNSTASVEIRNAYFQNLADFEDFRRLWLLKQADEAGEDLTDSQRLELQLKLPLGQIGGTPENLADADENEDDNADEDEDDDADEDEDDDENDLEVPSSPPQLIWPISQKHGREELELEAPRSSSASNKRQRIDKGKGKEIEIPSTPEDVFNANFEGKARTEPSPLREYVSFDDEDSDGQLAVQDEEPILAKPVQRNIFGTNYRKKPITSKAAEPETQDFHFSYPDLHRSFHDGPVPESPVGQDLEDTRVAKDTSLEGDSSTQSQTDSQGARDELQSFIDGLVLLGYEEGLVIEAMQATTMEAGDVKRVMESILKGDGIPDHIEGVWTAEDDEAVAAIDDGEYGWLAEKHGVERCIRRIQFLRDKREAMIALGQV